MYTISLNDYLKNEQRKSVLVNTTILLLMIKMVMTFGKRTVVRHARKFDSVKLQRATWTVVLYARKFDKRTVIG